MFAGDSHLRAAFGYLQQLRETTKVIIDKEMTHNMQVVFAGIHKVDQLREREKSISFRKFHVAVAIVAYYF